MLKLLDGQMPLKMKLYSQRSIATPDTSDIDDINSMPYCFSTQSMTASVFIISAISPALGCLTSFPSVFLFRAA